jgi:hypothetical protein
MPIRPLVARRRLVRLYLVLEDEAAARPLALAGLDSAVSALGSPLVLGLLRGRWPADATVDNVFQLGENPALASLTVKWLASAHVDPARRSEVVHDAIVLDLAGSQQRTLAALRLAARIPRLILPEHRRPIFERCLRVAAHAISPYERPGLPIEARLAAARLLEANPDLDEAALAAIPHGGPIDDHVRVILTTAIIGRSAGRTELFGKVIRRWRPSEREAIGFAEECDSQASAADPTSAAPGRRRAEHVPRAIARAARLTVPPLVGPASIAAAVVGYHLTRHWPDKITISLTESLAALGILVAVHVVSAELSAARLPGLIARWTSTPVSLISAYSCALTLLFVSVSSAYGGHLARVATRAAPLTLAAFVASLVFVLVQLVRRTDPANAARAFERSRRGAYVAAGRRFGRLQRVCLEFRETASTLPFVRVVPAITRVERHVELAATAPGLLIPSVGRLKSLERNSRWHNEVVGLELLNRPGTTVAAGEAIAAIVPAPDASVLAKDLRQARKVLRSRKPRRVHETGEAAVLLLNILAEQAEEGDEQAAVRVEEALIALLEHHLRGAREERPPTETAFTSDAFLPAVPAVVAVTKRAARLVARSEERPVREAVVGAMKRLLRLSQEGDAIPSLVVGALLQETREPFPGLATLLWEAGVRAVETRDRNALLLTQMAIEQRLRDDNAVLTAEGVETAARLCVLAVWNDQPAAGRTWGWFSEQAATAERTERILGALRIGSAALLAWNPSTVLRVALALAAEIDLTQLKEYAQRPGLAMIEQTVADQFGHYLAADAEAAFVNFLDFATVLRSGVR